MLLPAWPCKPGSQMMQSRVPSLEVTPDIAERLRRNPCRLHLPFRQSRILRSRLALPFSQRSRLLALSVSTSHRCTQEGQKHLQIAYSPQLERCGCTSQWPWRHFQSPHPAHTYSGLNRAPSHCRQSYSEHTVELSLGSFLIPTRCQWSAEIRNSVLLPQQPTQSRLIRQFRPLGSAR